MADLQRSIDFYDTLGFTVAERYEQEGWLLWCRLRRDDAELMLSLVSEPVHDHGQGVLLYLYVDDLDAVEARAPVVEDDAPRPVREMRLTDPDGHVVMVAELHELAEGFEQEGWNRQAASYDLLTGRVTARVAGPLLDAADVMAGHRVLDVACGTGGLSAAAARRGATPLGIDLADAMVDAAAPASRERSSAWPTPRPCPSPTTASMPPLAASCSTTCPTPPAVPRRARAWSRPEAAWPSPSGSARSARD